MSRELSSAQTFLLKIVFPIFWVGGFGTATIALFLTGSGFHDASGAPPPPEAKWIFLVVWILGGAMTYWACARLKRVRMDDAALYVSNYLREARVPLRQIMAVTENRWLNIHPVTIQFRSATEFGDRVVFMPKARWFAFWSPHPVVAEIRQAVDRATGLR